ncbi:hypothetical protein MBLNU457_3383t2 [Dothideomycetes sp. NU457]
MSDKERHQLQAELNILRQLDHPNIVRYYEKEHHKESSDLHLYMEYCGNGDLGIMIKDLKARNAYADEELVWTIFAQLVSALYRCHYGEEPPRADGGAVGLVKNALPIKSKLACDRMILHRDLKPENVFLGDGNAVKLGDFGLSKIIASHDFASTYVGTPFYMSPEICMSERYSLYSDIWSLGCVMYELCAGEPPFNAKTHLDLIQKIRLGKVTPLPRTYSRELSEVITACLQVNPNARPDTAALLNLPRVKLIRKSQMSALLVQEHLLAKNQAFEELRLAKEHIAALEAEKEAAYDTMYKKLLMEWEMKATLEINRRVDIAEKDMQEMLVQRVEEEVARRIAEMSTSSNTSWSNTSGSTEDPIPRSSTPPAFPVGHKSLNTVSEIDEEAADFSQLSLDQPESPLEKRHKPVKKSSRTPFTRARTIANAEELAPSPMDVHMADPSPIRNIASLSLSPRRNTPLEGTNLRQPALRGNNIFDVAATRESRSALFANSGEFADDDEDELDDSDSPTRPKPLPLTTGDPFKMPAARPSSSCIARPTLSRARTTQGPQIHQRMRSTPNVYGPQAVVAPRPTTAAGTENSRPSSPNRKPMTRNLASPVRKAPSVPSQPSPTALSARKGTDLVKTMHRNKLQGRTLVELNMAEMQNQQGSGSDSSEGEKTTKSGRVLEPLWDPERDEMPSPFLVKTRRTIASR